MAAPSDPGPIDLRQAQSGSFCWLDLAARDVALAREFYGAAFGWTFTEEAANGGRFTRLHAGGRAAGSLYQLRAALVDAGAPWSRRLSSTARRASHCSRMRSAH